mmetsp:Transcript_33326/g.51047  ORF Transcript_33326/g.51047 Transcript_33326/m.51047 type:complete len:227 (+) Transcript_33326:806-1486(+)
MQLHPSILKFKQKIHRMLQPDVPTMVASLSEQMQQKYWEITGLGQIIRSQLVEQEDTLAVYPSSISFEFALGCASMTRLPAKAWWMIASSWHVWRGWKDTLGLQKLGVRQKPQPTENSSTKDRRYCIARDNDTLLETYILCVTFLCCCYFITLQNSAVGYIGMTSGTFNDAPSSHGEWMDRFDSNEEMSSAFSKVSPILSNPFTRQCFLKLSISKENSSPFGRMTF